MKKVNLTWIIILIILATACSKQDNHQRTISFDDGWRFIKENPKGAENPSFDDSQWRLLDLPHDWSIEDLPNQTPDSISGPFSKAAIGKMSTGYTIGGTAWYRKSFTVDKADQDKKIYIQFDGVYMNSDVWINGKHVGNHPYGYTSFYYNINQYLNPAGTPNVIAVQVKNEGINSRWYTGSGIYRHVWLTTVNPIHIAVWGVFVQTPVVNEKSATINIKTKVLNLEKESKTLTLQVEILDPQGKVTGTSSKEIVVNALNESFFNENINVENPALWSIDNPAMCQAKVSLLSNNKTIDQVTTPFGIRSIHFDTANGFNLNGKTVELKGGCIHHDNGPLGSAAINRAEERKIEMLKKAGFNAIRFSHNPPSPNMLDVCDRYGIVVIDEFADMWEKQKESPDDYSKYFKTNWKEDLTSIIERDRNHPSVIMWSIGNEIPQAADTSGVRISKELTDLVRSLDTTRAVTEAMVDMELFMTGKSSWEKQGAIMKNLDVIGYNYNFANYATDHEKYPDRIMYASEFMPPLSLENWTMVEKLPYVIGNFTWSAMDYLGEAGTGVPRLVDVNDKGSAMMAFFNPNSWPIINNYQGDLDLIGNRKNSSYYQHVVWRMSPVEILVHKPIPTGKKEITSPWGFPDELKSWNWAGHEGEKIQVHVYTRSQLVKLELNGKPVGEQKVDGNNSITATFNIPYEPGTLTARCFDNGKETASQTIKTTGKPAAIRLTADRNTISADLNDLSYVNVEVVDADSNVVPDADNILINFEVSGNGSIAGVGNGNHSDISGFQQPKKKSYHGVCLAIVRPTKTAGTINLIAKGEGLKDGEVTITTK